jgi:hypothetical protein
MSHKMYASYNAETMVRRLSLSEFRLAIREVVTDAEHGQPTILMHYNRDAAAIVPLSMVHPPLQPNEKKSSDAAPVSQKRRRSHKE